jgi:hypothetical protein
MFSRNRPRRARDDVPQSKPSSIGAKPEGFSMAIGDVKWVPANKPFDSNRVPAVEADTVDTGLKLERSDAVTGPTAGLIKLEGKATGKNKQDSDMFPFVEVSIFEHPGTNQYGQKPGASVTIHPGETNMDIALDIARQLGKKGADLYKAVQSQSDGSVIIDTK